MIGKGSRVAVIDGVRGSAERVADVATEAGLVPHIISEGDPFKETRLLERIKAAGCSAVICDHQLSRSSFASFTGAEFMADLYRERIPGVLLSSLTTACKDISLKSHRTRIPSLLDGEKLAPAQILQGLRLCQAELAGHYAPERQPRRTLVRVVEVAKKSNTWFASAILHTWEPDRPVWFPLTVIENQQIREAVARKSSGSLRLFAQVNVGCRDESELFFMAFEFAPEPDFVALGT